MKYKWDYCTDCDTPITICNTCGNNVCNGGSGIINGQLCPDCDESYEAWQNETNCPEEYKKIFNKTRNKNGNSN